MQKGEQACDQNGRKGNNIIGIKNACAVVARGAIATFVLIGLVRPRIKSVVLALAALAGGLE